MEIESKLKYFYLFFTLFFLIGCSIKTYTVSPAIEGKVIDLVSKKPLENVNVGGVLTDKNGKFYIKGERKATIGTTMGGIWRVPVVIMRVTKAGYKPTSLQCDVLSTQEGCFDVVVKLEKD